MPATMVSRSAGAVLLTFKVAICVDRKSERIDPALCLDDFFRANPTILSILQLHGFVAPSNVKHVHCALSAQILCSILLTLG